MISTETPRLRDVLVLPETTLHSQNLISKKRLRHNLADDGLVYSNDLHSDELKESVGPGLVADAIRALTPEQRGTSCACHRKVGNARGAPKKIAGSYSNTRRAAGGGAAHALQLEENDGILTATANRKTVQIQRTYHSIPELSSPPCPPPPSSLVLQLVQLAPDPPHQPQPASGTSAGVEVYPRTRHARHRPCDRSALQGER